ncbi:hypothetical protein N7475_008734 [Penicillium sp. IBT 31633x]|nr:hypothetical protein N7475_008734 [Penicillium sp. IBT 31633x]
MQTQLGFPNDPIFSQLRRLAKQSPGVLFHDEYGVDARYSDLIHDVIHLREILREHLPSASFDEQGCLREDARSIAFLAYSGYSFIIGFFAIVALGGICVPLSTGLNPDEALYFLKKVKAAYILTEKRTVDMATTFTEYARNEGQRVTLITITRADPAIATISSSTELEINQELTLPETAGCLILFTSGTTGPPKGVVLPRKMFHCGEGITPATLYLASCPPHWVGGTGLIDMLREGRATEMAISPTLLRRLMEYYQENISHLAAEPRNEYIDGAKKLERVIVSGSMLNPSTWRFFADLTGMPIINGYGITEMGGGVIINPPGSVYEQGYIGKVIPWNTVKLSHGDHGEILVKSPIGFSHYIGDEAATRAAFDEEGFYKTGDQAHRVGDDYYFEGRISSDCTVFLFPMSPIRVTNQTVVRFHEYTISIPELERQLLDLPYITEAHVLPVKDHGAGGLVAALVRLQKREGDSITLKRIREDLAATNLASYKLPTLLRVLQNEEQVPLTPSEKVLKRECLQKFFHISEYIPDPYAVEGVEYCGNQLDLAASSRLFDWGGL